MSGVCGNIRGEKLLALVFPSATRISKIPSAVGRGEGRALFFIFILFITLTGVTIHLMRIPREQRSGLRVVEVFLLYFLSVQWGFGGIATALPHIRTPDYVAGYIGWQKGSPFQVELGFAALGLSVIATLCIWIRGVFWWAPAIGFSVFLYGAAYVHFREIAAHGNFSPGNAGIPLVFDLIIPTVVLGLCITYARLGGFRNAA